MTSRQCDRLFIVEDHAIFAELLASALESEQLPVEIVTSNHIEFLDNDRITADSLVLMDLELGAEGLSHDLITELAARDVRVVLLSGTEDEVLISRSVLAGASGFVSKRLGFDDLMNGIRKAMLTDAAIAPKELERYRGIVELARVANERLEQFDLLTAREAKVLWHLVCGLSVDEVSQVDYVSINTVRAQVRAILSKLGVHTQLSAVAAVRELGWAGPSISIDV